MAGSEAPLNRLANVAFTGLINMLLGSTITDSQAGFRVFRADRVKGLDLRATEFEIETEMVIHAIRSRWTIREVPVTRRPRRSGSSRFRRIRNGTRILFWILRERLRR